MSQIINVTIGSNITRKTVPAISSATLRQVLEDNAIDYTIGTTMLDGVSLGAGDIDKTFDQLGVTDRCYLLNIVKADNAATVKVFGSALVIKSIKLADIELLAKHDPEALRLRDYDDQGNPTCRFAVAAEHNTYGSLTKNGAVFSDAGSQTGEAVITIQVPADVVDVKEWVMDTYGPALMNLKEVEEQVPDAIEDVAKKRREIESMIEF